MVKVWAEKEMRNYRRIHAAGIPCPAPIFLKAHILLMEFLGEDGWPSPRLKDVVLSDKHMREAYVQTMLIMRHMYQRCKLVHGDFSEYNLLWHKEQIYVIDVSQSVEHSHPSALDFLRKDIFNVNDYFFKIGKLNVMTTKQLFEFITAVIDGGDDAEMECLEKHMQDVEESHAMHSHQSEQARREQSQRESVDEAVFMSSFLPRSLSQVADYDIQKLQKGEVEETYAHAVAALTGNQLVVDAYKNYSMASQQPEGERKESEHLEAKESELNPSGKDEDDPSSGEDDEEDGTDDEEEGYVKVARTPEQLAAEKEEKKASRKANKKEARGEKTERRKTKLKKKDKKRAINKAKQKK
jgi:RIO kinase 1